MTALVSGTVAATPVQTAANATQLDSLYDMLLAGGPLMVPIALCSVIALTYAVERWLRLSPSRLGSRKFGRALLTAVQEGGPTRALELCSQKKTPLARIMQAGLSRAGAPFLEVEKAVEDAGAREVRRLSSNLRPLVVVALIAPLLGLLGTVWGMISAFSTIAVRDGLGRPEMLASGISQALITTAAGLAIAIPTQAAYFFLRGRIDKFVRRTEDLYSELTSHLSRNTSPSEVTSAHS